MIKGIYNNREVYIDDRFLDPGYSMEIRKHSPDGFAWGYGGSGPAQLALALLLDFTTEEFAVKHYQDFKWDVVAKLHQKDFEIEESVITDWVNKRTEI